MYVCGKGSKNLLKGCWEAEKEALFAAVHYETNTK